MLRKLTVQNFALIDFTEFNPLAGLNIITGETGAGKSILLDALSLLTGQRANLNVIRDKDKKCIVEAEIDALNFIPESVFAKLDVDFSEVCIIRREIHANGNSRSFINDTPVGLQALKELAGYWIDIHSQFETAKLLQDNFWFSVLDHFSNVSEKVHVYKKLFKEYSDLNHELKKLELQIAEKEKDKDYRTYLLNELLELNYSEGEESSLDEELNILSNSENIREALNKSIFLLSDSEQAVINQLAEIKTILSSTAKFNKSLEEIYKRVESSHIELKDILLEVNSVADEIVSDPSRLNLINEKLSHINKLKRKHGVNDANELIKIRENLEQDIENANDDEEKLNRLKNQINNQFSELNKLADELFKIRFKYREEFSSRVEVLLKKLGIINATFKCEVIKREDLNEYGNTDLNILFSANKGAPLQKVSDVASGGELSRLMLSIKYIVSEKKQLPTIIFDEIDVGVSGEIAWQMAEMMHEMSGTTQLITITHSPQIAGKGNHHFFVYKETSEEITNSRIKKLNNEDRIIEIAKMLSHGKPTEAAINNAKELLQVVKS